MWTFEFWGFLSPWQDLPSDQRIKRISSKTALWTHPPGKGDVYSTSIMEQIWVCHACEAGSCFAHDRLGRVTLLCFHRCVTSGLTKSLLLSDKIFVNLLSSIWFHQRSLAFAGRPMACFCRRPRTLNRLKWGVILSQDDHLILPKSLPENVLESCLCGFVCVEKIEILR